MSGTAAITTILIIIPLTTAALILSHPIKSKDSEKSTKDNKVTKVNHDGHRYIIVHDPECECKNKGE